MCSDDHTDRTSRQGTWLGDFWKSAEETTAIADWFDEHLRNRKTHRVKPVWLMTSPNKPSTASDRESVGQGKADWSP